MYRKFTENVLKIIKNIPEGKVLSYGRIGVLAGNPYGARQVARTLHTLSRKHQLPWYRVVNSVGAIALKDPEGRTEQRSRLEAEGVTFSEDAHIDFKRFLWKIESMDGIGKGV